MSGVTGPKRDASPTTHSSPEVLVAEVSRKRPAKVVDRNRQQPEGEPTCGACNLTLEYLRKRESTYECSRVDCPQRKTLTAAPPA